jgi:hypothetical protein
MANKYLKKCSSSLAIMEMPFETTLRFHFILVRMAIVKSTNITNLGENVQNWNAYIL